MQDVAGILAALDEPTAHAAASAVGRLLGDPDDPRAFERLSQLDVQDFLWRALPVEPSPDRAAHHDVAWALGDVLELAGRPRYAALCRARVTHEVIAAWHRDPAEGAAAAGEAERRSGVVPPDTAVLAFAEPGRGSELEQRVRHQASGVLERAVEHGDLLAGAPGSRAAAEALIAEHLRTPSPDHDGATPRDVVRLERLQVWAARLAGGDRGWLRSVLPAVLGEPEVPAGLELTLAPVRALLEAVRDGVQLTGRGELPPATVAMLDDRFAWSDDRPRTRRARAESHLPPLQFLHQHLLAQRLLAVRDGRMEPSPTGRRGLGAPSVLWRAVVGPLPRWHDDLETGALAVQAGLLLRSPAISREDLVAETAAVTGSSVASVDWVRVEWYRVGVVLGWWERSRGRWLGLRLSSLGRAAAAQTFWSVAARAPRDR